MLLTIRDARARPAALSVYKVFEHQHDLHIVLALSLKEQTALGIVQVGQRDPKAFVGHDLCSVFGPLDHRYPVPVDIVLQAKGKGIPMISDAIQVDVIQPRA